MNRIVIISVISSMMLLSCANMEDMPEESKNQVVNDMITNAPLTLLFLPFAIFEGFQGAERARRAKGPHCTIYYCKQDYCGSTRVYIDSGKPEINLEEFLKDTIPEKTHHDCPTQK